MQESGWIDKLLETYVGQELPKIQSSGGSQDVHQVDIREMMSVFVLMLMAFLVGVCTFFVENLSFYFQAHARCQKPLQSNLIQ